MAFLSEANHNSCMEGQQMDRKKKKRLIVAASVVLVLAVGGTVVRFAVMAKSKSTSTTTFRRVQAETGSISTSVSGSGSVSDSSQITLSAANAGTVDTVSVKAGDTVKAGQVIAHVDSSASAQAVQQKQSQLTSAQNDLAQAQEQLDSLEIKAPVAGKVKSVTVSAGDSLATVKSLGDLAVLSTSRSMTVSFNPSETVKIGQTVTVSAAGKTYTGTISSASGSGQSGQNVQSGQGGSQNAGSSGSAAAVIASDDPAVGASAVIRRNGTAIGTGKLQLENSVPISNSGSGTVAQVYVSENQTVGKNQTLFRLKGDSVQNQVAAKQSAVTSAQQELDAAKASAAKDTVTSPIAGVVAELDVKKGDSAAAGASVAVIEDPDDLQTVVSVDELDISKVKVGQKATVSLDAVTGKTFSGSVVQVDPIGTVSNGVATYDVTVSIGQPQNIRVGMTTNVKIITESKSNVTVVSANAVLMKNGSKGYVLPAADLFDSGGKSISMAGTTTAELVRKYGKEVTIGMATQDEDEIVSGVSAGDGLAIPVTVDPEAVKSLGNQSTSNNTFGFSGMSGRSGMGNAGGMPGGNYSAERKSGGTGNTVAGNGSNGTGNAGGNGTSSSGGTKENGATGQTGADGTAGGNGN
jgi:HlyD family secretion protein